MPGRDPILELSIFIGAQPSVDWFATRVGGGLRSRPTEPLAPTVVPNVAQKRRSLTFGQARVSFEQPPNWAIARALHSKEPFASMVKHRASDR